MSSTYYLVTLEDSKVVVALEVHKLLFILLRIGGGNVIDQ
jgi:hypothetical protein